MKNSFVKKLLSYCKKAQNIAITGHKSTDFDAIGSCVAMARILKLFGITADIIIEKQLDENYLPILDGINLCTEINKTYDLVIALDSPDKDRLVLNTKDILFKIDHHITGVNCDYAKYNYVDTKASSTCEVLYYLFGSAVKYTPDIAKALFIGMYTDTGGFKFSNTTTKTFKALTEISKINFKRDELIRDCVSIISNDAFLLTQVAFNSIKFYYNNKIVVSYVSNEDFKRLGIQEQSCKFMPSYLPNIKSVDIAISITEKTKDEYNISLRTAKENIDVSKIALKFNGGGHIRASGLTLKGNYEKALNALLLECKKELSK